MDMPQASVPRFIIRVHVCDYHNVTVFQKYDKSL